MSKTATPEPATTPAAPPNKLVQRFNDARKVSVPLLGINTPDPAATIKGLSKALPDDAPTFEWDNVRGLLGLNLRGKLKMGENIPGVTNVPGYHYPEKELGPKLNMPPNQPSQLATVNPMSAMNVAQQMPDNAVVFVHNAQMQMENKQFIQALWNLRDVYKTNRRTIVLLSQVFVLPRALAGDVILLHEPLPTRDELSVILDTTFTEGGVTLISDERKRRDALDAVVGLPAFTAEQTIAMALRKNGVDVNKLWEHKINILQNTAGLRVYKSDGASLDDLQGIDNVKAFVRRLIDKQSFGAVVFIDEGDKMFAGGMSSYSGDSGVAKHQTGSILSYMEDTESPGLMFAGVSGTGKSQLAKAIASSAGKPLIMLDLGAMKGGLVGESEARLLDALRVITATAEGRVLFIMTANRTTTFSPELNRRFADQFFFDSPDDAGREAIWPVYIRKYNLTPAQAEHAGLDKGWTGAEIKRMCKRAAEWETTVREAAQFLIAQAVSAEEVIAEQRREAHGRFLSASKPGFYRDPATQAEVTAQREPAKVKRQMTLDEAEAAIIAMPTLRRGMKES